jgi:hypothetical protein
MEHVVFFPAHDGSPAFRRLASLEEAVRLVEHLRNVEGVESVSVHALTEVPLEFRPWFRVEMPAAAGLAGVPPLAPVAPQFAEDLPPAPVAEEAAPVAAAEEAPVPALDVPEQEAAPVLEVPAKASLGFFSRG